MKTEDFEAIPHEILICVGGDDKMVSIAESKEVATKLKIGKLTILPGFKHPIETVDVGVLANIIVDFFR